MVQSATVWVMEGEAAEAATALRDAGHRVFEYTRDTSIRPQFLVADMAHLGTSGLETVRDVVREFPSVTPILHHVWESHLNQETLGVGQYHLLLDPVSSDDLLEELTRAGARTDATGARVIVADLPSIPELVQPLVLYIVKEGREAGISEALLATALPLCVTEALVNAVSHGNHEIASRRVRLECRIDASEFRCTITDEGEGFDPSSVPLPTAAENLLREHGRGLFLMRHYMTDVTYNARGNSLTMRLRL